MPNSWTQEEAEEIARMDFADLSRWLNVGLMCWSGSRVTAFNGTQLKFDITGEIEPQVADLIKSLSGERDQEHFMAAIMYGFESAARPGTGHELFRSLQKIVQLVGDPAPVRVMILRLVDDEKFCSSFTPVMVHELYQGAFDVLKAVRYTLCTLELVEKLRTSSYYDARYADQVAQILTEQAA